MARGSGWFHPAVALHHRRVSALQSTAYPLVVAPGWRAELREKLAASR
jgi:hypothetical protein